MTGYAVLSQSWLRYRGNQVRVVETETAEQRKAGALFISGGACSFWQPVIQKLQHELKCITLELPENPLSLIQSAHLLEAALGQRSFEPLVLVGHDFGAAIAQVAALHLGPRAGGLVLIDPRPVTEKPPQRSLRNLWPRLYERLAWKRQLEQLQLPTLELEGALDPAPEISKFLRLLRMRTKTNVRRFPWR